MVSSSRQQSWIVSASRILHRVVKLIKDELRSTMNEVESNVGWLSIGFEMNGVCKLSESIEQNAI